MAYISDGMKESSGLKRRDVITEIDSLFQAVVDAVMLYDIPLELALRCITCNPAARLGLFNKGRIEQARDADFVMLNPTDFSIQQVWTNGIARLS